MMKQLQFYKYSTWVLLLLNVSMIAFFILTAPQISQNSGRAKKRAIETMKLDKQQHETFLRLASQHVELMDGFNHQQRILLKPYFNSIISQNKAIKVDSLLQQVQLLEREKIETTYQHFQDIRAILRPEQYPGYEEFVEQAIGRILLDEKKNPPPPKDFK